MCFLPLLPSRFEENEVIMKEFTSTFYTFSVNKMSVDKNYELQVEKHHSFHTIEIIRYFRFTAFHVWAY